MVATEEKVHFANAKLIAIITMIGLALAYPTTMEIKCKTNSKMKN
jgi:hypothetical protein